MNFKTTYLLFGLLAVMLIVFGFALWLNPGEQPGNYVLPAMHDAAHPFGDRDVTRVEIERARPTAEKIVLVKTPGTDTWTIAEPHAYRADRFAVEDLVRQVWGAEREPHAEPGNDPKRYGLDPPAEVVTLIEDKEGAPRREVKLNVGDASPGTESALLYVSTPEHPNQVFAVKKGRLDAVLKPVADFRSRDLLSPSSSDITAVTLSEGKKGPLELKKSGEELERWVYVRPPFGRAEYEGSTAAPDTTGAAKAPDGVRSLLTDLSNLRVENTKDFVADDVKDLAKYHLDPAKDDVLRIAIDRTDQIATGEEGKKERKTSHPVLLVGVGKKVDDKSDQYYAMLEEEKTVVKLPAKNVEPLRKLLDNLGALRDRNLVESGGFKKPDAVTIENSYGKLEFRRGPGSAGWKLYRGDTAHAVDEPTVQQLVTLLTQKNVIESFPDPKQRTELGLGKDQKPDVTVSVWLDGIAEDKDKDKEKEKEKEKKEAKPRLKEPDKPTVVLRFGHKQERSVAVDRKFAGDAEGTLVLVPDKLLDQVREGPLAYLDRTLPQFAKGAFDPTRDVTRLVIQRGGTTSEVARDKPESPWKIVKPDDQKDRLANAEAVRDVLDELNRLRAVKLVAEKADAAQLAEYGLKPPLSSAAVTQTKDGKPETFEVDFGKEAPGQGGVYARLAQGETIYVLPGTTVAALAKEMRDPTVFHFDVAKVREVKLTGWHDPFRGTAELVIKRKEGGPWAVEKPAGVTLSEEKLRKFLDELSNLRATGFVSHKGPPTAEQGLDLAKGALRVEVTVEGEKESFVVTVGSPDGNKGFFATSNRLKDTVFDVRKDTFEGPKSNPGFFSK
jgi:hypothetical protein